VLDLVMVDGECRGVIAWSLMDGTLHRFRAQTVILATGGYGRIYFSCTSAHTCTGDGGGLVLRAGAYHCRTWSLCSFIRPAFMERAASSRKVRAEKAATLANSEGERFMERYAPRRAGSRITRRSLSRDDGGNP